MEHFVLLNFLTHSKMFNWCLVLVKLREYQNLQAFLFNCKNSTTGGYIQSTLSILLKIEHIEIKKKVIQLFVFSVTRKWSLKIVLWESYEAGLKIFSSFFFLKTLFKFTRWKFNFVRCLYCSNLFMVWAFNLDNLSLLGEELFLLSQIEFPFQGIDESRKNISTAHT